MQKILEFLLSLQNKTFVVVWIALMQPLLSITTMKGKISKKLEVALWYLCIKLKNDII